jgi:hypothetical protein
VGPDFESGFESTDQIRIHLLDADLDPDLDPDSMGSLDLDPDPDPGGEKLPAKIGKKLLNFSFLKCSMFSFEG